MFRRTRLAAHRRIRTTLTKLITYQIKLITYQLITYQLIT